MRDGIIFILASKPPPISGEIIYIKIKPRKIMPDLFPCLSGS